MSAGRTSTQRVIRWGILGAGNIAEQFAEGLRHLPDARLHAIGSRTRAKAERFAGAFAVPRAYDRYEDLVGDKDIDAVYVATLNHRHKDHCLLALEAGKAVLCEKPFAVDATQAREVIALARRKRLFCMEAMWMRFLPIMTRLRSLLEACAIGDIRLLRADFGIAKPFDKDSRFFCAEIGGGATLNFGVYLSSLAFHLLGRPCTVTGHASFGASGVDEQSVGILRYPKGALAVLTASIRNYIPCEATIVGTRGEIRIHAPLYRPHKLSLSQFPESPPSSPGTAGWLGRVKSHPLARELRVRFGDVLRAFPTACAKKIAEPFQGNGLNYEAAEVMRCLRAGELESAIMPLDETLSIMEMIDAMRRDMKVHR